MSEHSIALYDAFSDRAFGGSVAGVVGDAAQLSAEQMQAIAREVGAPATGFVTAFSGDTVDVRFFSTMTEYPMCGHGTIGLMTWLMDSGQLAWSGDDVLAVTLRTGGGTAAVTLYRQADDRARVMLNLGPPEFEPFEADRDELADLLAIPIDGVATSAPIEISTSEFNHLMVPIAGLDTMRSMTPNFSAIAAYSRRIGVDTVCVFTKQTAHPESAVHCREFAPAVGTSEAPASGTTNRALACYLFRHGWVVQEANGPVVVLSEQGFEMGRQSRIRSELDVHDGVVTAIRVGGVATRTIEGTLHAGSVTR